MSAETKEFFFDQNYLDRFNRGDIPTEQVLRDLIDSIPFFKEPSDSSQLTKAGISKITTDKKINDRADGDAQGISPLGFATFAKPSQIFNILENTGQYTVEKVVRNGTAVDPNSTDGSSIEDIRLNIILMK